MKWLIPLALLASAGVHGAERPSLAEEVRAILAAAGPGPRFGLVVADAEGHELLAIAPDDRFLPASNTKVATTVAAFARLPVDAPDLAGGASVRIEGGDVILSGHGDARLSSAPDCLADCLATLADAVAAGHARIRDVVGDDSALPDERWSPGMSWDDMETRDGTAISALTLDNNVAVLTVRPGTAAGVPAIVEGDGYLAVDARVMTGGPGDLRATRAPGGLAVRIEGGVAPGAPPRRLLVGIEDPAHRAAWVLAAMLRARGVRVTGQVVARHRPAVPGDDPGLRGAAPVPRVPEPPALARVVPGPLAEDVAIINKQSQNLHADLLLRRLGQVAGTGSIADGLAVVAGVLAEAGVPRRGWDLSDGSGMSVYNRVSPRAMATLVGWAGRQRWAAAWRATLPIAGVDGTLRRRFAGTALAGRMQAKTGTLRGTSALAGYMTAASGRTLTFAAYANDVPGGVSATAPIDAALLAVAARL